MKKYQPATQAKIKEVFMAEACNPTLHAQIEEEFEASFKAADVNNNGVLTCAEFKCCMCRQDENMRRRFGEWAGMDATVAECWYKCYNRVTCKKEGVSLEDFKFGDMVMKTLMVRCMFEPLVEAAMKRMAACQPATQAKMKQAMQAERKDPALFNQIMDEFEATFHAADANKDGLLNRQEFKAFSAAHNENAKRRYGESMKAGEAEEECWYKAYCCLSPGTDGISIADFKMGRIIFEGLAKKMALCMCFKPLLEIVMGRMSFYSPEAQAKIQKAWTCEEDDPALHKEMMDEFAACFKSVDSKGNGLLECAEFKVLMQKNHENMKRRFGQSEIGDDCELDMWYQAYNGVTPARDGVSLGDFKEADGVMKEIAMCMSKSWTALSTGLCMIGKMM